MNRSWAVAVLVSVAGHVGFYLGPWSVSRDVASPEPPVLRIELTPPTPPEPPPPEPEPEPPEPEPEPPPPEPEPETPPPEPPPPKQKPPPTADEPPPPSDEPPPEVPVPETPTAPANDTPPVADTPPPAIPKRPNEPTQADAKPTPAPKPSPKPGMSKADFIAYATGMRGRMLAHRRYPPAAKRNGLEGRVKVKVSVDRRGRIVGKPSVARSCGHKILDDEALRMVKVAAPFAPLPNNADKDVMVFVVPIDFKLEG